MVKRLVVVLVLAALAACSGSAPKVPRHPDIAGGIHGTVRLGPLCPVQSLASPCPDKPVEGWIGVQDSGGKWSSYRTSGDGTFSIALQPGSYQVTAREIGDNPRTSKPVSATVRAGSFTEVDLQIDTGIR